jgi:aspartyl-tRNA synthetase
MVRSVEHYPSETIVVVIAKVRKAPKRVKNATIHNHELEVYEVHKVGNLTENVPFTVYDAENINRDREDIEDEDDEGSLSSLYPSNADTPGDSPRGETPRVSADVSRFSLDSASRNPQDKLASRSEYSFHS